MNYPFWETGLAYGKMMGGIAILHVFISHFAIGGGLYLVVHEMLARKRGDARDLDYLERLTKFFVLTTLVMGALTGVGIWFIIGLLNPAATEVLIHHYVWGWAIEWTFFVTEITAAILYYYGWKRMSGRDHVIMGWIYFVSAWMSLFVINGIITFMLTPGEWLSTGQFWDGFFNPGFWASLVYRTGITIMLAGLWGMVVISRVEPDDFKKRVTRRNALWGLAGMALVVGSHFWYTSTVPQEMWTVAIEQRLTPIIAIEVSWYLCAALVAFFVIFGLGLPRAQVFGVAGVGLAIGILWFGSFEWYRESMRKPYVIWGYMYGNGIEVAKSEDLRENGILGSLAYRTGDDGRDLYQRACRTCHTLDGYKPLKPAFDGTDEEFITGIVMGASALRGNMPPFVGTEEEARLIAAHLREQMDTRHLSEIHGLEGAALGEKVYEVRCGKCHIIGGFRDVTSSIAGLDDADYEELLDNAADYADEMPAFTGDAKERAALIEFMKTLEG